MIRQFPILLPAYSRGFHVITQEVLRAVGELPEAGLLHLFIRHTSAALAINESADPAVLRDMERHFERLVPEGLPGMEHDEEGPDDMPAHVKAVLAGPSLSIPILGGGLALGTWQGIWLCEFRNRGGRRSLLATILT
jgi:secondary thiamine-phosphate synthase enzyme